MRCRVVEVREAVLSAGQLKVDVMVAVMVIACNHQCCCYCGCLITLKASLLERRCVSADNIKLAARHVLFETPWFLLFLVVGFGERRLFIKLSGLCCAHPNAMVVAVSCGYCAGTNWCEIIASVHCLTGLN